MKNKKNSPAESVRFEKRLNQCCDDDALSLPFALAAGVGTAAAAAEAEACGGCVQSA